MIIEVANESEKLGLVLISDREKSILAISPSIEYLEKFIKSQWLNFPAVNLESYLIRIAELDLEYSEDLLTESYIIHGEVALLLGLLLKGNLPLLQNPGKLILQLTAIQSQARDSLAFFEGSAIIINTTKNGPQFNIFYSIDSLQKHIDKLMQNADLPFKVHTNAMVEHCSVSMPKFSEHEPVLTQGLIGSLLTMLLMNTLTSIMHPPIIDFSKTYPSRNNPQNN